MQTFKRIFTFFILFFVGISLTISPIGSAEGQPLPEATQASSQEANPTWRSGFSLADDANGRVYAAASDNFGNVYLGGEFTEICGQAVNYIAKWNGKYWDFLVDSSGHIGHDERIVDIATSPTGELAVLSFGEDHISIWNGIDWIQDFNFDDSVLDIIYDDAGNLYIGGAFTNANGQAVQGLAVWDGSALAPVTGNPDSVSALAFDAAGNLFVGVDSPDPGRGVSKWDGTTWTTYDTGFPTEDVTISELHVAPNDHLYALGSAKVPDINLYNDFFAENDGSGWVSHSTSITSPKAITSNADSDIFIGGDYLHINGEPMSHIAQWDGTEFLPLGSGIEFLLGTRVSALAIDGSDTLFVGGLFFGVEGMSKNNIARWHKDHWLPDENGVNGNIQTLAETSTGDIYAIGNFTKAGDLVTDGLVRWDGESWENIDGLTADDSISSQDMDIDSNDRVYAFGELNGYGRGIGIWDGTNWVDFIPEHTCGEDGIILDNNDQLYLLGDCSGVNKHFVAKWNGTVWEQLGTGDFTIMQHIRIAPDGSPVISGHDPYIYAWNGIEWAPYVSAPNDTQVTDIHFGPENALYIAVGNWGVEASELQKWNGISWETLLTTEGPGTSIKAINSDRADRLYVAGYFSSLNGDDTLQAMAYYEDENWHDVGLHFSMGGYPRIGSIFAASDGSIWVYGSFTHLAEEGAGNLGVLTMDGSQVFIPLVTR